MKTRFGRLNRGGPGGRWRLYWLTALTVPAFCNPAFCGQFASEPKYTLGVLSSRSTVETITVSPDGQMSAVLISQPDPLGDLYRMQIVVVNNEASPRPIAIAQYSLGPDDLYKPPYLYMRPTAGGFVWAPDSSALLYLLPGKNDAKLEIWSRTSALSTDVLTGHAQVALADAQPSQNQVAVVTLDPLPSMINQRPPDKALLMKEGYRFYGDLKNPKTSAMLNRQEWTYDWNAGSALARGLTQVYALDAPREFSRESREPASTMSAEPGSEVVFEDEYPSPNGNVTATLRGGYGGLQSINTAYSFHRLVIAGKGRPPVNVTSVDDGLCRTLVLGWNRTGDQLYYVEQCHEYSTIKRADASGKTHVVLRDPSLLLPWRLHPGFGFDPSRLTAVFGRSSTFQPDEVVAVDLRTGGVHTLINPNSKFMNMPRYRTVNLVADDKLFKARLYLPDHPASNIPLVVTLYYSTGGFETSTGDEVPILALVESGIAVMTVDADKASIAPKNGGPSWEISRVERPTRAIEDLIAKASANYSIDKSRVGLTGLSFGSEIAMYAYWNSRSFRAVSTAEGSWSPAEVANGGLGYAALITSRGFTDAYDPIDAIWSKISAAMNARSDLPPLLWQTPDDDRYSEVESWFRLRKGGAQLEWLEYPNESHIKRDPANKYWVYSRNFDWFRFWLQDYEDKTLEKQAQYERWRAMKAALPSGAQTTGPN